MKAIVRIISIICIAALMFTIFTGCQKNDPATPSETSQQQTGSEQQSNEKPEDVTLRFSWWGGDARHEAYLNVIDLYTEQNPHVKIDAEYGGFDGYYQKMITQLSGRVAPDIMQVAYQWIPDFEIQGIEFLDLYSVTDIVDVSGVDENLLSEYFVVNGKLQGLPAGVGAMGIIYNKDFFEKFNIPFDTEWTWEKIIDVGKRVHQQDQNSYLLSANLYNIYTYILPIYLKQINGAHWIKDDYTLGFEREHLVDLLTFVNELYKNSIIQPLEETALVNATENPKWLNGETGMIIEWSSLVPSLLSNTSWEAGAARIPVAENAKNTAIPIPPTGFIAVSDNSNYIEEAAKFLNFFINDTQAVVARGDTWGTPSNIIGRQAAVEAGKINIIAAEALNIAEQSRGLGETTIGYNAEIVEILKETIEKVGFGRIAPDAAADELISKLSTKLEEFKN